MGTTTLLKSVDWFWIFPERDSATSEGEDPESLGDWPGAAGDSDNIRPQSMGASAVLYFKAHILSVRSTDHLLVGNDETHQ